MPSRDDMERHAALVNGSRALVRLTQLYEYDLLRHAAQNAVADLRPERRRRLDDLEERLWPTKP